jgi:hypothetical protein
MTPYAGNVIGMTKTMRRPRRFGRGAVLADVAAAGRGVSKVA